MNNFTYEKLKDLLKISHEIEFTFANINCSINNLGDEDHEHARVFSTSNQNDFTNTFLADFYDTKNLFTSLDKIKIKEKSLKEIIDNKLYDPLSLTIF